MNIRSFNRKIITELLIAFNASYKKTTKEKIPSFVEPYYERLIAGEKVASLYDAIEKIYRMPYDGSPRALEGKGDIRHVHRTFFANGDAVRLKLIEIVQNENDRLNAFWFGDSSFPGVDNQVEELLFFIDGSIDGQYGPDATLFKLAKIGNGDQFGNSVVNAIAIDALRCVFGDEFKNFTPVKTHLVSESINRDFKDKWKKLAVMKFLSNAENREVEIFDALMSAEKEDLESVLESFSDVCVWQPFENMPIDEVVDHIHDLALDAQRLDDEK